MRADGTTGPCCSGLAYEARGAHPFTYGCLDRPGDLLAAWRAWREDQLLRVMRLAGLSALEGWLSEANLPAVDGRFASDPCEACLSLWRRTAAAAEALAARACDPAVREKLDALETALYGSVWTEAIG